MVLHYQLDILYSSFKHEYNFMVELLNCIIAIFWNVKPLLQRASRFI
jgi:hypothetical protein